MFAAYSLNSNNCNFVRTVSIAGILGDHIASKAEANKLKKNGTMPWDLSGCDLCRAVIDKYRIEEEAASRKVVVDATYTRADALILEINTIWGFSYGPWTPILLRMSVLFEGDRPHGKSTPVAHFRVGAQEQGFVHEFLYLQCGHGGGTRNWGRMGYTNAALLWPDALAHLLGQIGFEHEQKSR
jgi:hypothetical protein